jgi:hypothetical protein
VEKPEDQKFTHAEVNYQARSTHGGDCDDCVHFIDARKPRCEGVLGPISPEGWCKRFSRDKQREADGD